MREEKVVNRKEERAEDRGRGKRSREKWRKRTRRGVKSEKKIKRRDAE